MASDFELTIGANDKAWGSAMKRVERDGSRAARDVESRWNRAMQNSERAVDTFAGRAAGRYAELGRSVGVMGTVIAGGVAAAGVAIKRYNDEMHDLDSEITNLKDSAGDFAFGVGRDLTKLIDGWVDGFGRAVSKAEELRGAAVNTVAGFLGADGSGLDSADAERRAQGREATRQEALRQIELRMREHEARAGGDDLSALDVRQAASLDREKRFLESQKLAGVIDSDAQSQYLDRFKTAQAEERQRLIADREERASEAAQREDDVIKRNEDTAKREAEARVRDAHALRQSQDAHRERFDRSLRMLELDELSAEGKDKEAKLLQEQLRYEEDLKSIRESSLSQQEKFDLQDRFRDAHNERVARIEAGESEVLSRPGAGSLIGGSAQLQRQVFGGSTRSEQLLQQIASNTKDTADSNREMANNEGTPALAG